MATGMNSTKGLKVHLHVDGQPVGAKPPANLEPKGCELGKTLIDREIDAWLTGPSAGTSHPQAENPTQNAVLKQSHPFAHHESVRSQIHEGG
ncbi:MAG: hypothetical protein RI968_715 [Pseudomonadota bacterium]